MKKIKNITVLYAYEGLGKILFNEDLLITDINNLTKTFESLEKQYNFISDRRNDLIKKYRITINDKTGLESNTENINKFNDEFNQLLDLEEELDIREFDLNHIISTKLKYNEYNSLKELFKQ